MLNKESIRKNYENLSDAGLINLAKNPSHLRADTLPILREVMISRGLVEGLKTLEDNLFKEDEAPRYSDMPEEAIKLLIKERLKAGESLESIKLDLKDDGVNFFDLLDEENKSKDRVLEHVVDMNQKGLSEHEIDESLKENFDIELTGNDQLKQQLKTHARQNLTFGYLLLFFALLMLVLKDLNNRTLITEIIAVVVGIWRVLRGHEQLKEVKKL